MIKLHFHADSDGVVSAYFVSRELERLGIKHSLHPSLGARVKLEGEGNVALDLSLAEGSGWNLSIDHHVSERLPLLYANPRLAGFEWPVSFITYALFGSKERAWVAAIGVVADWCAERVPPRFWDTVREQWPELVPEVDQKKLVKGKLGELAQLVESIISVERSKGALRALRALKGAESWKEFARERELQDAKKLIEREVERSLEGQVVREKFALLRFSSPYRIKSLVAARMKELHPGRMVVVAQDEGDRIRLSFRNGDGLDRLVKELTEGIGTGGGHPQASGGWIDAKSWDEFVSRLSRI